MGLTRYSLKSNSHVLMFAISREVQNFDVQLYIVFDLSIHLVFPWQFSCAVTGQPSY